MPITSYDKLEKISHLKNKWHESKPLFLDNGKYIVLKNALYKNKSKSEELRKARLRSEYCDRMQILFTILENLTKRPFIVYLPLEALLVTGHLYRRY